MARRMPPVVASSETEDPDDVPLPPSEVTRTVFDPIVVRSSLRAHIKDPRYWAIMNQFRDRQQYGRIAYETAYQHEVVGSAFKAHLAVLTSKKPIFRPRARDPTITQEDLTAFYNHGVQSLDWPKFIDGVIGQGREFGFSLTEITTKYGVWKGNDAILLDKLWPLPQASLDHGFVPREETGAFFIERDGRYRCFDYDKRGRITAYIQHAYNPDDETGENQVRWEGADMERILHYTHGGGDGNPCGESALFHTMPAFLKLYGLEMGEDTFLDTALPWLFGTYKTQQGETRPKIHDSAKNALQNAHVDASQRFLMWGDGDLKSVAPSNENYTDHVFRRKAELEARIWQTLLFPKSLVAESAAAEGDSRNLVQVFFKYTLKADLEEIGNLLTDLFTRLARSNFTNLTPEDIPVCTWSTVTENEMRVAQGMLAAIMPHIKSAKLQDFVHSLFEFVQPEFIAENHEESVAMKRPLALEEGPTVPGQPPQKEPGSVRQRTDGQTENPSTAINTST